MKDRLVNNGFIFSSQLRYHQKLIGFNILSALLGNALVIGWLTLSLHIISCHNIQNKNIDCDTFSVQY